MFENLKNFAFSPAATLYAIGFFLVLFISTFLSLKAPPNQPEQI